MLQELLRLTAASSAPLGLRCHQCDRRNPSKYKELGFLGRVQVLRVEEKEIAPLQCFPNLAVNQSLRNFLKMQVP